MEKSQSMHEPHSELFLDPVVLHVIRKSKNYRSVKSALIFGSRSRGDHGPKSDYDFAFVWVDKFRESWGDFTGELREGSPTLHQLDLIREDTGSDELRQKIASEGTVIYG